MVLSSCGIQGESKDDQQQRADSMLLYLARHGEYISSVDMQLTSACGRAHLHEFPPGLQLASLCLEKTSVQLFAGNGMRGVLKTLTALTRLQLRDLQLLDHDGSARLAGALQQLPKLQHLEVVCLQRCHNGLSSNCSFTLPSEVLQQLQGLTHLELKDLDL